MSLAIKEKISRILDENRLDDLNRFLNKRKCLNNTNTWLIYAFYLVQSAGIFTTSIAAGTNNAQLVWIGVGLSCLSSLISIYEKTNSSMMKKILMDIQLIADNRYIDEGEIVDVPLFMTEDTKKADTTPSLV